MTSKEKDSLDAFIFGEGSELVDFKCFRGDGDDVTAADIKEQIHSAFMQKRMGRAVVSEVAPTAGVATVNVKVFVESLAA